MRGDSYRPVTFVREATRAGNLIVAKQRADSCAELCQLWSDGALNKLQNP
jgi:hypothetical protein